MTVNSDPEWFTRSMAPTEPPKSADMESLRRKNLSCRAKSQRRRVEASLEFCNKQLEKYERGLGDLSFTHEFLLYYEKSLSGEYGDNYPEQPWFPLMKMTLDLWKSLLKELEEDKDREILEAAVTQSFIAGVKGMGFNSPTGGEDE